jgi:type VI secretion system ImpA/VasJ family protein
MIDLALARKLGSEPISGDKSAGEDARYDSNFEAIEAEIAKLESLEGGVVDWELVIREATTLLTTRSKHLLVSARLVRAWYQREGIQGLLAGLELLNALCSTFWDGAFPEVNRPRARSVIFKWLADGLSPLIKDNAHDSAATASCLEAVNRLIELIQPRFSDGDCGLGGLRRALDAAVKNTEAEAASQQAPDESPVESSIQAPAVVSAPARATASSSSVRAVGPIASRDDALRRLHEVAEYFQRAEPHSPVGFLAQRAAALGAMNFQDTFTDLLHNNTSAQSELWQVLGIKSSNG